MPTTGCASAGTPGGFRCSTASHARRRASEANPSRKGVCDMLKLHVAPPSPRAFKVLAVARHLGLDFELCPVDLLNGAHLRPEFVALNPNKRMPVLEDDGFVLWESNDITQYLASKKPDAGLLPLDPRRRADVSRWQFWENAHWDPACGTLIFERLLKKVFGQGDPTPAEVEKGAEN